MKYLAMVLALLTWTVSAQAAIYRFDAYVEENSWTCLFSCFDSSWNPLPKPEPWRGALEGEEYTGLLKIHEYGNANIWLSTSSQIFSYYNLYWKPYLDRYDYYMSGWIEYLEIDMAQGTGKYIMKNDDVPYYQRIDIRLSNISQVPLPASGVLLLAGLGGLALGRRFKRPA